MRVSRSSTLIALILAFIALAAAQTASPWQVGTSYVAGALVTYNGATYKCTQAHTAQIDWSPAAVPALWQAQGGSVPAPPTTERAAATPAPPPGSGCAPAWDEGAIYTGGQRVSQDGKDYRAAWWTQGDSPANNHGVGQPWVLIGACGGAAATTSPPPTAPPTTNPPVTSAPTQPPPATATPTKPPATTSAPTLPPSPPSNGTLPKRVLMGYWQNFDNGATCLRLSNVPAAYNLIAASFADSTAVPGEITFKVDSGLSACLGGYTDDMFIADVRVAHSKGQKVVVSVGGQYGLLNVADTFTASRFADSVYVLMQRFGFDGVDIDLENGINPTYMAEALHKLARRVPGVVITLAPQTIDMQNTGSHYFHLALLIKDILTMSNTQYYNSGSMLGCNGGVYAQGGVDFITALACIQLQGGLRADQIGIGLPATPSGAGSGYVAPTIVVNALNCITTGRQCGSYKYTATYPNLRGAMTWSINWDAKEGYPFMNTVSAGLAALP